MRFLYDRFGKKWNSESLGSVNVEQTGQNHMEEEQTAIWSKLTAGIHNVLNSLPVSYMKKKHVNRK